MKATCRRSNRHAEMTVEVKDTRAPPPKGPWQLTVVVIWHTAGHDAIDEVVYLKSEEVEPLLAAIREGRIGLGVPFKQMLFNDFIGVDLKIEDYGGFIECHWTPHLCQGWDDADKVMNILSNLAWRCVQGDPLNLWYW